MSLPTKKTPADFPFKHSGQADAYGNDQGGNTAQIQTNFDSRATYNQTQINEIIDGLQATTAASEVGYSGSVPGASTIKQGLDILYSGGSGSIPPDGSITRPKLANDVNAVILNNSKGIATNSAVIDELLVAEGINTKLTPTSGKFYDYVGASGVLSQGSIDTTKAYCSTVTTATNNVTVSSMLNGVITDFEAGQEITLQDDTSKETLIIQSVSDPTITFTSNVVNTYSNGANVYRSNIIDGANAFEFGGFQAETVIDKTTPVQVVNAAYDTSGNGGRKIVRLNDGTLISALVDSGVGSKYHKSIDNGDTWTLVTSYGGANISQISIETDGVNILVAEIFTNSGPTFRSFDVDGTPITNALIDSGQSAMGNVSLTIAPNGDLHATWASKNATYPNSFNIRYSKSTDGGFTWDAPTQITNLSNVSYPNGYNSPTIVVRNDGNPTILYARDAATKGVYVSNFNGATWDSLVAVYDVATYIQSNPSADVLSDGTIIVAWHGRSATSTNRDNVYFSKSSDNGVTWDSAIDLTGNLTGGGNSSTRVSITRNTSDEIYAVYCDAIAGGIYQVKFSGSWGSPTQIYAPTNVDFNPSTLNNYRSFTNPIMVWDSDIDVKFYGKWTEGTTTAITDIDIRFNITPLIDVSDIGAYMNVSDNVLAVDGSVSIVDSTANESYTDLVDTRYTVDANNDEVASLLNSTVTAEDKVTLKYNVTRTLTTDDIKINSILGGVS